MCFYQIHVFDWDWWHSPVIKASVTSDFVDILRQGIYALTGGACMDACTIGGVLPVKGSDPYLL